MRVPKDLVLPREPLMAGVLAILKAGSTAQEMGVDGSRDGRPKGAFDGSSVGNCDERAESVGSTKGTFDGWSVGNPKGTFDGSGDRRPKGTFDSLSVGNSDGSAKRLVPPREPLTAGVLAILKACSKAQVMGVQKAHSC